jgi:hypothetical protein
MSVFRASLRLNANLNIWNICQSCARDSEHLEHLDHLPAIKGLTSIPESQGEAGKHFALLDSPSPDR